MPLQRARPHPLWAWVIALAAVVPTIGAIYWAAQPLWAAPWWQPLSEQGALHSLALSAWTAIASTVLSVVLCNVILSRTLHGHRIGQRPWTRHLGWALATPHLAFALALGWLIAPTGLIWRALASATGWPATPIDWPTTHDPLALAMIAVLVMKELPFLLWISWAEWQRADQRLHWQKQWTSAQTWGYDPWQAWRIAVAPDLWMRMRWPVLAVWAYGWGVVDVGLAIGPTTPPTGAVLAWQWLHDADAGMRHAGVALSWLLGLGVALGGWAIVARRHATPSAARLALALRTRQRRAPTWWQHVSVWIAPVIACIYLLALAVTLVLSFVQLWPYPELWPTHWTSQAWQAVWQGAGTISDTLTLSVASTFTSMVLLVAWFEAAPRRMQQISQHWALIWLVSPPLLWLWGLHSLMITWGFEASWSAVYIGHVFAVLPYVLLTLGPAYLSFDTRFTDAAATLGKGWWSQCRHIKWPMLRAPLWRSAAIGWAVSVTQYLPTEWLGGGRVTTLTTEALAQSSGGQRSISAAWALAQWVLPMLAFAWAMRQSQSKASRTQQTSAR